MAHPSFPIHIAICVFPSFFRVTQDFAITTSTVFATPVCDGFKGCADLFRPCLDKFQRVVASAHRQGRIQHVEDRLHLLVRQRKPGPRGSALSGAPLVEFLFPFCWIWNSGHSCSTPTHASQSAIRLISRPSHRRSPSPAAPTPPRRRLWRGPVSGSALRDSRSLPPGI